MAEKTAVQDLIEGIEVGFFTNLEEIKQWAITHGINTEKQQIEVAWQNGYIEGLKDGVSDEVSDTTAEQYYSHNYKQD